MFQPKVYSDNCRCGFCVKRGSKCTNQSATKLPKSARSAQQLARHEELVFVAILVEEGIGDIYCESFTLCFACFFWCIFPSF